MKNGTTTMRLLCLVLSMLMLFSLAACGEKEDSKSSQGGPQNSGTANQSVHEGLIFGEVPNAGANPNNLIQCRGGIAFDSEYIYFRNSTPGEGTVAKVRYDGTGYSVLSVPSAGGNSYKDRGLFNVKDGFLYYYDQGKSTIVRYELSSGNTTELMHGYRGNKVNNMLVVGDYLYAIFDADGSTAELKACNLKNLNTEHIMSMDNLLVAEVPVLTTDGKTAYVAFVSKRDFSVIQNLYALVPDQAPVCIREDVVSSGGSHATYVFATNGYYHLANDYSGDVTKYDLLGYTYEGTQVSCFHAGENGDEKSDDFTTAWGRRFILGENFLLLRSTNDRYNQKGAPADIVMYSGMNFSQQKTVYTVPTMRHSARFGVHDNTFYLIETNENDKATQLVIIDQSGNVTKKPIQ